jgi:hypothetical protein
LETWWNCVSWIWWLCLRSLKSYLPLCTLDKKSFQLVKKNVV